MKKDIILSGVGGQGILSIATIIGQAATAAGVNLKQAEVHGMSQRGGDVQSHLRLSTETIHSDLIPTGCADIIIAMEPMEALRYLPLLAEGGCIVTSSRPLKNIPNYPPEDDLLRELDSLGRVQRVDIETIAAQTGNAKGSNMVLLGMAAGHIGIISAGQLRDAIRKIFASKGAEVVESNLKAFDAGINTVKK